MKIPNNTFSVLFFFLFFINESAYSVDLSAVVDRKRISINESLRLIITADINTDQKIDFSQLQAYFDVINTQRRSRQSNAHGKISSTTQWVLTLTPKEAGRLLIPSFELAGSYSQPLTITVEKDNSNPGKKGHTEIFLQASVDKDSVYVQEQILLKLRLYYQAGLSGYSEDGLKLGNVTSALVSENNFQTQIKNKDYNVLEKVYALHPQSSGKLTIPESSWRLEKSSRSLSFGYSSNPYIYVKSNSIIVNVKPIPDQHQTEHWLPSSAVALDTEWRQSLTQATVGEPLNLEFILTGNGLSASQLPDIDIADNEHFTVYSDLPESSNTESAIGIIGTRTSKFVIIPKKAGKFSFPSIRLAWWNIDTDKEETIFIPKQTVIVSNSKLNKEQDLPTLISDDLTSTLEKTRSNYLWLWQTTTALLALACLALLVLYAQSRKKIFNQKISDNKVNSYLSSTANNSPKTKSIIKGMQAACIDNDWKRLRLEVINWGKTMIEGNSIESLQAISQEFPELDNLLKQLDNQLYGNQADDSWNPHLLVDAIKTLSVNKVKHKKEQKQKLTELYTTQ